MTPARFNPTLEDSASPGAISAPHASFAVDLRSDTVTRPSRAMREAIANADVGDDVLDGDPTVMQLEQTVADLLGKERGLFFPSGTMANQAAIWLHTTPGTEILLDADAHILHWEIAGAAALCGVQVRPVRGDSPVMRAHQLRAFIRTPSRHAPEATLVCVENTHNGAGGMITPLGEMRALQHVAEEQGLPVHLDGARLWNAAIASGTSLAEFASCADTVMVSFSKGLGAPVGAALVGSEVHIARAHRIRKRLGGGMRQSGILAAAALHGVQHNLHRLEDDHEAAREFARVVDGAGDARVVPPDTNIVMIDLPAPVAAHVVSRAQEQGVRLTEWSPSRIRAVTHLDAPLDVVRDAAKRVAAVLQSE